MALMITDREGGCMGRVPKSVPGRETGLWERLFLAGLPNGVMGAEAVGWNVYNSFSFCSNRSAGTQMQVLLCTI